MTRRVTVVSAHPDDETLGCGGALLKHISAGDELSWIIATKGWVPLVNRTFLRRREKEIDLVAAAYAMKRIERLGLPTTKLDSLPFDRVIRAMRHALDRCAPDIVYVVNPDDVHADHRIVFDATWVALKPTGNGHRVGEVLCYETLSSTNLAPPKRGRQFAPDTHVDISKFVERKLQILSLYQSEIFSPPHPRSLDGVRSLARYRGAAVAMNYAEAFVTMRRWQ